MLTHGNSTSGSVGQTTTAAMNFVDLIFPAQGAAIPRNHGYALYGAVARIAPTVHAAKDIGIFPINGTSAGDGTLLLNDRSSLRFRVLADRLPILLPLAGKAMELDGHRLRLGVPHVAALIPAPVLSSSLVLIKLADPGKKDAGGVVTPDAFLAAAKRKLVAMNIDAEPGIQKIRTGPRAGQARRRVIRVKDQTHVGYGMIVQGLTAEESIRLQEAGIGGRRLMGCGLFLPERSEKYDGGDK
jgi:CRISPR-associated protein Cas6